MMKHLRGGLVNKSDKNNYDFFSRNFGGVN